MITVEYVREKYPKEYWDLSDRQVQDVINLFYGVGNAVLNHMEEHPNESIFKPKTPDNYTLKQNIS